MGVSVPEKEMKRIMGMMEGKYKDGWAPIEDFELWMKEYLESFDLKSLTEAM